MELLIKNKKKLAMKGLGRFGFILLSACLFLLANTAFAQSECAEKIEYTVQSIDETIEGTGNAKLVLSGVPDNSYFVNYTAGSTYSGAAPTGTYGALAAATETNTLGRYIATGLTNPAGVGGDQYTVRVQMPDNSCYSDSTIVLPRVNWSKKPEYTDLEVTVAKSGDATTIGQTVTVTVTVTNNDTNTGVTTVDATGVEIAVYTPAAGLTFVASSASTASGTFNETTMEWSVGTVAAGATLTLQLSYVVSERGVFQFSSEVKSTTGTEGELDSVPLDDDGGTAFEDEDDESSVCISTPWDWCTGDSFDFVLNSNSYTGITWQKNNADITASVPGEYTLNADGSLTILSIGTYNFVFDNPKGASCDATGCCPINIVQGVRPELLAIPPAAICLNETLPTIIAQDNTAVPGDYDSDRGAPVYQWLNANGTSNPTTDSLTGQTSLTLDLSVLPQTAGTYHYQIKAYDDLHKTCIDSTTFEFVITDIEKPIASSNTPICEEEQIELTVTNMTAYPGGNYDFNWWFSTDSTRFTAVGDSVGLLDADPIQNSGDYIVQVSQTFTSPFTSGSVDTYCAKTDTVTMVVNPLPIEPTMKDSTYCQYEQIAELIEHVVDSTGGYLRWYQTKAGTAFLTDNLWPKPDSSVATQWGPYYVTQTDANGCQSYPDSFVVNINALPEPPLVQDLAYCEGATGLAPLDATPLSGGYTLKWYSDTLATGAGNTVADPAIPTPDASAVDTLRFYVTQTLGTTSCESYNAELVVYIKDTPDRPSFADPIYCLDETTVTLDNHLTQSAASTTSPSATYVHWTYPGFTDDGSTSPTPSSTDAGSSYGLVWEAWDYLAPDASTLTCTGPQEDLRVIINPKPEVDLISVNALCIGDAPQNDARLYITEYRDSDKLLWHVGTIFDEATATANAGEQVGSDIRANGGAFASSLTNPKAGDGPVTYAVQIENEFGCIQTGNIVMTEKDCVCPGGYCEPATITRTP